MNCTPTLARNLAVVSTPHLMAYDYVTLQQMAEDAVQEPDVLQLLIIDKEGLIAGITGERERVGRRAEDSISLRGLAAKGAFSALENDGRGGARLVRIEPVLESAGGSRWGTIQVAVSMERVLAEAQMIRVVILLFALLGFACAFGVSQLIARRITRPLTTLPEAAEGLVHGEWRPSLAIRTGDEIEMLAERFGQTAERLDRQRSDLIRARDDLRDLNASLEEKVRQRTLQLEESREKYRLLVEASPDLFCLLQGGRFKFVNRAFLGTFGYTDEQVANDTFGLERVVHPDFTRIALDSVAETERSGRQIDADWVGIGRGGKTLDFQVRGHRVSYHGAAAVELLWIDLTERKQMTRQMVQAERLSAIGEMTAMVAHNFNNLLAVILGRTQLLLARADSADVRKGLEVIRASAIQGGEIVKRVQEYAGSTNDLPFREVNASTVLREVVGYLENLWRVTRSPGAGPIRVEVQAEEVPTVDGSETLIAEVMKHLLLNAADSMPGGGTIRASVRPLLESVLIQIEDSGVGMTAEVRKRAFDPFFTTKGPQARGLGLSVSYGIVQRHRGRIDVWAREEGGTVAQVYLPVQRASRPTRAPQVGPEFVFRTEEQETARRLLQGLRDRTAEIPERAVEGEGEERVA
ncbi:MAG: PAS domain S-box protein [Candidatus Eisenbacteria bacterium]|nr:PAS domain S-box protein [Candidatus Eisenbacteria bacterium]